MGNNSKFKILEHTADLKIQALGKTKEELFLNMLKGMASVFGAEIKDRKQKTRRIKVKSLNIETLLVDFLSEVLYLSHVNREIYYDIKLKTFNNKDIEGKLIGYKVERFREDIKGVTYHGLSISKNKEGLWETTVIFDI